MREIVKDPFVLDFLAADPVRERDLSKALTDNLARFLRELGTGFAFVGAEVPVQCGEREFFLDLLFYSTWTMPVGDLRVSLNVTGSRPGRLAGLRPPTRLVDALQRKRTERRIGRGTMARSHGQGGVPNSQFGVPQR